jgi:hypothetical protein
MGQAETRKMMVSAAGQAEYRKRLASNTGQEEYRKQAYLLQAMQRTEN